MTFDKIGFAVHHAGGGKDFRHKFIPRHRPFKRGQMGIAFTVVVMQNSGNNNRGGRGNDRRRGGRGGRRDNK